MKAQPQDTIIPHSDLIQFSEVQFTPVLGASSKSGKAPRPLPPIPIDPLSTVGALPNPHDPPLPASKASDIPDARHSHEPRRPSPLRSSFTAESLEKATREEQYLASIPSCLRPSHPSSPSPSFVALPADYSYPASAPPSTIHFTFSTSCDDHTQRPRRVTCPEISPSARPQAPPLERKARLPKGVDSSKATHRPRASSLSSIFDKTPKSTPNNLLLHNQFTADDLPPSTPIYVNRLPPSIYATIAH